MDKTALSNLALQAIGTRTTLTSALLAANGGVGGSNEAIQINIAYNTVRNQLLRTAPWNCAFKTANLTYITSAQGTPENTAAISTLWQPGLPPPPWAYEYQFPVDCLLFCYVTPQVATGFAGGIPISPAVTGGAPSFWQGPPVKFRVQTDKFFSVGSGIVTNGGAGYSVGDILSTPLGPVSTPPFGAPAQYTVTTAPGGVISAVTVVNQINGANPPVSGSYFSQAAYGNAVTGGTGTGALITPSGIVANTQRVILTNQEFAIGNYIQQVTDENLFDDLFQGAFYRVLGAAVCKALTGDKALAKIAVEEANAIIMQARRQDGNEGLTINDVTPDWIRSRGINFAEGYSGPYNTGFDWGQLWPGYN